MKKAKERIDAEAAHPMTRKQKWDNFWFYYRRWVFSGAFVAVLLGFMIYDFATKEHPDYSVGLLSPNYFSPETITQLEMLLETQADDRNGDGEVMVSVLHYQIGIGEEFPVDPNTQMAATTRFAGDMQTGDSILFLSEYPVEYQKFSYTFQYNDGEVPPEDSEPNAEKLGIKIAECPVFDEFMAAPHVEALDEMRLLKRVPVIDNSKKQEKAIYYDANMTLFDKLTAK